MRSIVFSKNAKDDLAEAAEYISEKLHNRTAAYNLIKNIHNIIEPLKNFSEMGTLVIHEKNTIGYRYLVSGNYLIFYHSDNSIVYIDRILYGRRDYLMLLFGERLNETDE